MDDFIPAVILMFFFTVVIVIAMCVGYWGDSSTCSRDAFITGNETKMVGPVFNYDCYIKVDDNWIPRDKWRVVEE